MLGFNFNNEVQKNYENSRHIMNTIIDVDRRWEENRVEKLLKDI